MGKGIATQTVWKQYHQLMKDTTEFNILKEMAKKEITKRSTQAIADAVLTVRNGKVTFTPGYDGEYGIPHFGKTE